MGRLQQLARQGLLLLVLLIARGARAEGDAPQRSVEIVLVGKLAQDAVFAARITSWFPVERFSVKVRRARYLDPRQVLAPSSDTDVRVWVTLSGDNVARLYFSSSAQASGASYFLRDLRLESGLDEIGAEHIAEVLHLSTQAFLDGQAHSARAELEQTLQAEPQPAPAPARVPPRPAAPAPPPVSWREWGAGVGYGVSYRADEGIWHGPRASVAAAFTARFGVRFDIQGALPQKRQLDPLELRFGGVSFLVAAVLRQQLGQDIALEWFAGPGLEVVRYDPVRPLSSEYAAGSGATEARPNASAGLSASFGRKLQLTVIAGATVPLTETHYDVVQGSERRIIGEASPVVPTLGVEMGF